MTDEDMKEDEGMILKINRDMLQTGNTFGLNDNPLIDQ